VRASIIGLSWFCWSVLAWPAAAQPPQSVGTFRWQLQPYCNIVTLTVTQTGGIFTLDGFDDQCDGATRAPVTGMAVPNPDGTVEIGLSIVSSPGAAPVHVAVPIGLATLGGPWKDSAGNAGMFAFTRDQGTGGSPRPATATLGAVAINPSQVQLRVSGDCPAGQVMQRINQDGTVACAALPTSSGDVTGVTTEPGSGLQGGAEAGAANLKLATTATGAFDLGNRFGLVSAVPLGYYDDSIPVSGPGKRLVWWPRYGAFRVGEANADQWDQAKIGPGSVAMGVNTIASGTAGFAMGQESVASGFASAAFGYRTFADENTSVALGANAVALGGAFTFGDGSGNNTVVGYRNQFVARATGGTMFYSNNALTTGAKLAPGASSWSSVSDVNMKEHFRDLDGEDVLAKLARMPIREWSYKSQDASIRHAGPTAQDFHDAFGLGEDRLRISTIDADGVALRAVQALEARTRMTDDALARENADLKAELLALRERLERLERQRP